MFEEFTPISKKEWLEKVEKDLKGRAIEELQWHLGENLVLGPFYHPDDSISSNPINGRESADWEIGEDFSINDFSATNKQLLDALNNGINAPCLIFHTVPSAEQFGIALKDVVPSYIKLYFRIEGDADAYIELLNNYKTYLNSTQIESTGLEGGLYFDPQNADDIENMLKTTKNHFPDYRCINITRSIPKNESSEIADYLFHLITKLDQTFQWIEAKDVHNIQISIEIGKSYFAEIAKIRALRILWDHLCSAYQLSNTPIFINAFIHEKAYDQNTNTNMIRAMTVAMSGVIGGVDRLTIRPADHIGNSMTRRIARNVQHLLKMESYMDRVIDPAEGSYYIEKLTNLFVEKAWEKFTSV